MAWIWKPLKPSVNISREGRTSCSLKLLTGYLAWSSNIRKPFLTRIKMSIASNSNSGWVRTFEVRLPQMYHNHTLYEVVSVLYPAHSPEVGTKISTLKRFSEFQKLHKGLKGIHESLRLEGVFPDLPRGRKSHRFQEFVIEERRKKALELLNFAATSSSLYNSQVDITLASDL